MPRPALQCGCVLAACEPEVLDEGEVLARHEVQLDRVRTASPPAGPRPLMLGLLLFSRVL
jgi:hypothetical protein